MYKITKNKGRGKGKGKGKGKDREEKKDEHHEHQLDSMGEEDHRDSTIGDGDDDIACQDREDSYSYHFTTRNPRWSYLKLELISHQHLYHSKERQEQQQTASPLDALTTRTYLTSALSQFLGLTGTSIPIDILKVSSSSPLPSSSSKNETEEKEKGKGKGKGNKPPIVFIRVPREDASAVVAALSSWIGSDTGAAGTGGSGGGSVAWRICARANFLGAVIAGSGAELFSS